MPFYFLFFLLSPIHHAAEETLEVYICIYCNWIAAPLWKLNQHPHIGSLHQAIDRDFSSNLPHFNYEAKGQVPQANPNRAYLCFGG